MAVLNYIPNPSLLAEAAVLAYVSCSFSGSALIDPTTEYYAGVANTDKEAPAVLVYCNSAQETYFQTRVYRLDVDISTRMMAADSLTSGNVTNSAMSFGGNVSALFGDTNLAAQGINALDMGLGVYQVQVLDFANERDGDAWISNLKIHLIAGVMST
jgi:hypothetical protein